jgi:cardiolipin synthase
LPNSFLEPFRRAGVEVRVFNPLALQRMSIRNHRKLLVCDERVAFVGGFNISDDYLGDGVTRGWRDVGVRLTGPLVEDLAATFEEMFALADFQHKRLIRLARARLKVKLVRESNDQLLLGGPGRGRSPIRRALLADLKHSRCVQIAVPYFIPSWRIRRLLARAARHGGHVQLLLPGKSDVALAQLAGRSLYRGLLRAGVEVYEYQPQVLHAKLFVLDDNVYVGSSNLDPRSLSINYELLVLRHDAAEAGRARIIFADALAHSRRIGREELKQNSGLWTRLKEYFAYWLLVRIDPHVARKQWRALPE